MSDPDLLARYAHHGDHDAFRTLVERHLDLVYSVARRHLRDSAAAEDVAQAVFVQLARHARQLKPGTPLVAWLHLVSRRTALNALRGEIRRQARESAAVTLQTMNPPPPAWTEVEPLLDEAVESLGETNRAAILLRFFENKSLREVGAALGTSEDAAQKRVGRAVEELRTFFEQRGVAMSATGFAAVVSDHALQAAPTGLAASIANTAAAAGTATSTVLAMTTLQKSLAAASFVLLGGAGLYESALAARPVNDLAALRARNDRTTIEIRTLRSDRDATAARLKIVEEQIDTRLAAAKSFDPADALLVEQMTGWITRMDRVKQFFVQRPELSIPELQYLKEEAWYATAGGMSLDSEEDLRKATSGLRLTAENLFKNKISNALRAYVAAHDDTLPASPAELAPYFDPPIDRAILDRYEMLHTGRLSALTPADRRQVMGPIAPPDAELDSYAIIGPNSYGNTPAVRINLQTALQAFAKANPDRKPTTAAELRPFLKWPMRDEAVQKWMGRMNNAAP